MIRPNRVVSVLCAAPRSAYHDMPGVVVYDRSTPELDAWSFGGGTPIVAHPPCRQWSAFCAHQAVRDEAEKRLGIALVSRLLECGGVLEQPAHSRLFTEWLAIAGVSLRDLPPFPFALDDGRSHRRAWQRLSRRQRSATTPSFASWLVEVARLAWLG